MNSVVKRTVVVVCCCVAAVCSLLLVAPRPKPGAPEEMHRYTIMQTIENDKPISEFSVDLSPNLARTSDVVWARQFDTSQEELFFCVNKLDPGEDSRFAFRTPMKGPVKVLIYLDTKRGFTMGDVQTAMFEDCPLVITPRDHGKGEDADKTVTVVSAKVKSAKPFRRISVVLDYGLEGVSEILYAQNNDEGHAWMLLNEGTDFVFDNELQAGKEYEIEFLLKPKEGWSNDSVRTVLSKTKNPLKVTVK